MLSAAGAVNPDAVFKLDIFQGDFLDAKASAVYGVFLGVGSFMFALCRAKFPKLALFSTFGNVVLDLMCVRVGFLVTKYGPDSRVRHTGPCFQLQNIRCQPRF